MSFGSATILFNPSINSIGNPFYRSQLCVKFGERYALPNYIIQPCWKFATWDILSLLYKNKFEITPLDLSNGHLPWALNIVWIIITDQQLDEKGSRGLYFIMQAENGILETTSLPISLIYSLLFFLTRQMNERTVMMFPVLWDESLCDAKLVYHLFHG